MNERTTKTRELILALIDSFTERYYDTKLTVTENLGTVVFTLRVSADDHRKVVGKEGSHIKALKYIVDELAAAHDARYDLRLTEPVPGPETNFAPVKIASTYSPHVAKELLGRVLDEIVGGPNYILSAHNAHVKGFDCAFLFKIHANDSETYSDLIAPAKDDTSGLTTVAALGTLFRAYANKEGTSFRVEAIAP